VRAFCFSLVPKPCRKPKLMCRYVCGRVLHPDDRFRSGWNICLAFFIIYCGAAVPLEIGFETDMVEAMCKLAPGEPQLLRHECVSYLLWFWLNFIVDLFFICDIVINFRTGYVHEGHFVSDDWLVAKAYMRGSFVMDVLGTFPLNVVMMIANPANPYAARQLRASCAPAHRQLRARTGSCTLAAGSCTHASSTPAVLAHRLAPRCVLDACALLAESEARVRARVFTLV